MAKGKFPSVRFNGKGGGQTAPQAGSPFAKTIAKRKGSGKFNGPPAKGAPPAMPFGQ